MKKFHKRNTKDPPLNQTEPVKKKQVIDGKNPVQEIVETNGQAHISDHDQDFMLHTNTEIIDQEYIPHRDQDFLFEKPKPPDSAFVREPQKTQQINRQRPPEAYLQNTDIDLSQGRTSEGSPSPDVPALPHPEIPPEQTSVSAAKHRASASRRYHLNQEAQAEQSADVPNNTRFQERDPLHLNPESEKPSSASNRRQKGTKYHQKFRTDTSETPSTVNRQKKRVQKAQIQAEAANAKLEAAQNKIPKKKVKKHVRLFDEQTKKATSKMQFEETPLARGEKRLNPPKIIKAPAKIIKGGVKTAGGFAYGKFHQKINEVEQENAGTQTAHLAEKAGESTLRGTSRATRSVYRFAKNSPYRAVEKLEKQAMKANVKLSYRKALAENPSLKSSVFSRFVQKQKIKRQYAKAYRETKKAGEAVKQTGSALARVGKAVVNFVRNNPVIAGIVALILVLICFLLSILSSCSNTATGIVSSVLGSSYLAEDSDINNAELVYGEWEADLQIKINHAEIDHPGYDEYRYEVGDIGHDPFELMGYLTALYQDFTYAEAEAALRQLFAEQYTLTFEPEVEVRYRDETHTWTDASGVTHTDTTTVQVAYDWHILNVKLTAKSFSHVIYPKMDTQQREMFELYMRTKGNRQYLSNPFSFNWLPNVTNKYGWYVPSGSGQKDFHQGLDIGVPVGTDIMAGMDGVVISVGNDTGGYGRYVVIENEKGVQARFAHCNSILVAQGQTVTAKDVIAKSGNSGNASSPHLHLEIIKDGEYLNPIFFAETGDDGSSRIPPGSPGGVSFSQYPGEPITDSDYAAMIAEAEKHLGKRYVFGANGPNNFDCSSFVSWVLDKSGVYPMRRMTAQGIYNFCTPVSKNDARPGDLIFFTGTYSTSDACSHIGIYVGNGQMIHCGNPIQYTSINTSYWQNHFYSFARIPK